MRALGPPFEPATAYCGALVIALVRVFVAVTYAGIGLLWAAVGARLLGSAEGLALATE